MSGSGPSAAGARPADVAVIGGGAVGMATAMALATHHRANVVVVEAEATLAAHQTGNNSGVIHSGLYYKPGSLKARLCTAGREALYRFCAERGIPHERCSKIVVATSASELPALAVLQQRGEANGLAGMRRLGPEELKELEPQVAGIAGLHVRETGIVDYRRVTAAYAEVVREHGGTIRTHARVHGVTRRSDGLILHTGAGDIACRGLVNAGGLHSDRVAAMCGVAPEVRIVPFRGEYYRLAAPAWPLVRNLIYPVPDPAFPFLGVHFTRRVDGSVEAGPNAVLALSRHGYRWRDVSLHELASYAVNLGFWRMARRSWRTGFGEVGRSLSHGAFTRALQELVPDVQPGDLVAAGSGVRAQALRPDGTLADDFVFAQGPGSLHVLSAPSPAATACLAIGAEIAARVEA